MQQRDHRMTADEIRSYNAATAAMDEYGRQWKSLVNDAIAVGVTPREIAKHTGEALEDVLAALGLPIVLAQHDDETIARAVRKMAEEHGEEAGDD